MGKGKWGKWDREQRFILFPLTSCAGANLAEFLFWFSSGKQGFFLLSIRACFKSNPY
jgi:hypothetical protein